MTSIVFAGILGILYVILSVFVARYRRKNKIFLMTGGDDEMGFRMRAHGNFQEYTPIFLLLLYFAETQGASAVLIAVLGSIFVFGRLSHAFALIVKQKSGSAPYRVAGMMSTFGPIMVLSVLNLFLAL